jgi:hypothetical protein
MVMEHGRAHDLTEAVLDLASVAAQILAHMARWQGHSAPDAAPPESVFRELVGGTLRPVLERHPSAAVDPATAVLADAVATIEAEIVLVEPPRGPRPHGRHSQSPRRSC